MRNLKIINNAFRAFDNDYSGQIGFTELVEGLETMGILLELDHMKKLFNYLDANNDGQINFSEF
jgi:Ca2+-binding EF-hand superfamily protein